MLQSFAPSPIASVIAEQVALTERTTAPFCSGLTRQQITALHLKANSIKAGWFSGRSAAWRQTPSMMRANSAEAGWARPSRQVIATESDTAAAFFPSSATIISRCMALVSSDVATPMLIAVSTLSPVSIQILSPASCRDAMVSLTSSCSWSSTAVAPQSSRSVSNWAATFSTSAARSTLLISASLNLASSVSYSVFSRWRPPTHSTRRPSLANSSIFRRVLAVSSLCAACLVNRFKIALSAPLQYTTYSVIPPGCSMRQAVDEHFLAEVNSKFASIMTLTSSPKTFTISPVESLPTKLNPKWCAA
mmetsp:Transcript_77698/g.177928  ORF Transcript_77698/g.177928 Transcript_77698/m.177928 type:complete len:305 (+) Transcript_77698:236-1150(+)